jgi:hypothetical protein
MKESRFIGSTLTVNSGELDPGIPDHLDPLVDGRMEQAKQRAFIAGQK